ncbi:MAG: (d)CMP kinase [Armatimonadetes bacterium]|nr:(d)CMP kinase [Armatimonadota bacterium]MBX3109601.1 (d)CMP kinase [Fimbriimonadaceae bacterium]
MIVAIDGPAGAGKSTVARLVADRLGLEILDTGAMYRAVALAALRSSVSPENDSAIDQLMDEIEIGFGPGRPPEILLNGEEVGSLIRTLEVSQLASRLSTFSPVRRQLVAAQQRIIREGNWVLEGRDVTTVVAPGADVKVFLTASIEERARRRWVDLAVHPSAPSLQEVVKEVVERDHRDYTRADSPLMLAEDAVIVETFALTPIEVADRIVALAK